MHAVHHHHTSLSHAADAHSGRRGKAPAITNALFLVHDARLTRRAKQLAYTSPPVRALAFIFARSRGARVDRRRRRPGGHVPRDPAPRAAAADPRADAAARRAPDTSAAPAQRRDRVHDTHISDGVGGA